MKVVIVPVLSDNYSYLIVDQQSGEAAAVDPADPALVQRAAKHAGVTITAVLTTHHHADHAGGNIELARALPGVPIYGGVDEQVPACTHPLTHGDAFVLGDDAITVKALHTPGHTKGHISFYVTANNGQQDPLLFTGDTLFIAGCGRFFEGTPADMYHSLIKVIAKLPPATKIYCGHEYTVKNLRFAIWMEPGNFHAKSKLQWAMERRAKKLPTVPSTLTEEMLYNPFLRCETGSLQSATGKETPEEVLGETRARKDSFA